MKNHLITLLICIILLIPITSGMSIEQSGRGDTLYVGGSGPGNYSAIQSAIAASNDGDTIYVYSGIYNETLAINRAITLQGENRNTTIIDGNKEDTVVKIFRDGITIRGFTLKNCKEPGTWWGNNVIDIRGYDHTLILDNIIRIGYHEYNDWMAGIYLLDASNTVIQNNIIDNIDRIGKITGITLDDDTVHTTIVGNEIAHYILGVRLYGYSNVDYNTLSENNIHHNRRGIDNGGNYTLIEENTILDNELNGINCMFIQGNTITGNQITNNGGMSGDDSGLSLYWSNDNVITHNEFSYNDRLGIYAYDSHRNQITDNFIEDNTMIGILLLHSYNTVVTRNTLIDNDFNALFEYSFPIARYILEQKGNDWNGNYWSDSLTGGWTPKIISGYTYITAFLYLPWFNVDWHPAREPYDIK